MEGEKPVTESSVRRRLIGAALRRCREDAGYTLDEPARLLECDRSKVSRIETGVRGIRPKELRKLLEDYGVPAEAQETFVALARQEDRKGWWHEYAHVLPAGSGEHIILEAAASELMIYETQFVPDLLQTAAYAQAVAEHNPSFRSDRHRADAARVLASRQASVIDGRHQLTVVISETALHQQVGGPAVMHDQLTRLARCTGEDPDIGLRVLPFSAGAHAASGSLSHTIMRFPHAPSLSVVSLQALSTGVYLDKPEDVARYLTMFAMLGTAALSPAGSARLIGQIADGGASGDR
jgi:transcriptional regulator with XRE-family HTH domain